MSGAPERVALSTPPMVTSSPSAQHTRERDQEGAWAVCCQYAVSAVGDRAFDRVGHVRAPEADYADAFRKRLAFLPRTPAR